MMFRKKKYLFKCIDQFGQNRYLYSNPIKSLWIIALNISAQKYLRFFRSVNLDWETSASKIRKLEMIFVQLDISACKVAAEKFHSIQVTILNMMKVKAKDFIILIYLMKWWIFCMLSLGIWTRIYLQYRQGCHMVFCPKWKKRFCIWNKCLVILDL